MEQDLSDPSSVSLFFSLSCLVVLRAAPFPVAKKEKTERNGNRLEKKKARMASTVNSFSGDLCFLALCSFQLVESTLQRRYGH